MKLCPSCWLEAERSGQQVSYFDLCVKSECESGKHDGFTPHWRSQLDDSDKEFWDRLAKTRRPPIE